jgi:hypothetical protein
MWCFCTNGLFVWSNVLDGGCESCMIKHPQNIPAMNTFHAADFGWTSDSCNQKMRPPLILFIFVTLQKCTTTSMFWCRIVHVTLSSIHISHHSLHTLTFYVIKAKSYSADNYVHSMSIIGTQIVQQVFHGNMLHHYNLSRIQWFPFFWLWIGHVDVRGVIFGRSEPSNAQVISKLNLVLLVNNFCALLGKFLSWMSTSRSMLKPFCQSLDDSYCFGELLYPPPQWGYWGLLQ